MGSFSIKSIPCFYGSLSSSESFLESSETTSEIIYFPWFPHLTESRTESLTPTPSFSVKAKHNRTWAKYNPNNKVSFTREIRVIINLYCSKMSPTAGLTPAPHHREERWHGVGHTPAALPLPFHRKGRWSLRQGKKKKIKSVESLSFRRQWKRNGQVSGAAADRENTLLRHRGTSEVTPR